MVTYDVNIHIICNMLFDVNIHILVTTDNIKVVNMNIYIIVTIHIIKSFDVNIQICITNCHCERFLIAKRDVVMYIMMYAWVQCEC